MIRTSIHDVFKPLIVIWMMEGKNNVDSLRVAVIIGRLVDGVKFNASRSETFPAKNVA